jgi:hypothetical protein
MGLGLARQDSSRSNAQEGALQFELTLPVRTRGPLFDDAKCFARQARDLFLCHQEIVRDQ